MTGWRWIVGVVLILHGVGHALGIIPAFADISDSWNLRSWLLTDALGETSAKAIGIVLWAVCLVGFVVAGSALLGVAFPLDWWRPTAVVFAVVSLVTLTLFWNGFPALVPNKVGAIAVNAAAIIGIVFASWPSDEMLGL